MIRAVLAPAHARDFDSELPLTFYSLRCRNECYEATMRKLFPLLLIKVSGITACTAPTVAPPVAPSDESVPSAPAPPGNAPPKETERSQDESPSVPTTSPPSPSRPVARPEKCHGSATDELKLAIRDLATEAKGCYDALLKKDRNAEGKVTVRMRIEADGSVLSRPEVSSDTLGDADTLGCIQDVFAPGIPTAPPDGGCALVAVPLNFTTKKADTK